MKENINALDEIHKGACMGMDAINFVKEKIADEKFKKVLKKQYKDYEDIANKIETIYPKYNNDKPHKTSLMNKAMTWYGIEMETMKETSSSKIAGLLLNGVNMGIIEGRKVLDNKNIDKEVHEIVAKYVTMQEISMDVLKKYL